MSRVMRWLVSSRLARLGGLAREESGAALMMLLAFMVLAVPLTVASLQVTSQFSRSSQIYNQALTGAYSSNCGMENTFFQLLNDPAFDTGLTQATPTRQLSLSCNSQPVTVNATKIFSGSPLTGQGLMITKAVVPTSTTPSLPTTYTYAITIKNEGSGTAVIKEIVDYLPPKLTYVSGSTTGLTTVNPSSTNGPTTCGTAAKLLTWNVAASNIQVASQESVTLTFQTTGTLPDGTYYNQSRVLYDPWWTSPDVYVYTPYTAPIAVGTGSPQCGYDMALFFTKTVTPPEGIPGVETEFTYTITIENTASTTRYLCQLNDLLPPTFTYVDGSSNVFGNITTTEPTKTLQSSSDRWDLKWVLGTEDDVPVLATFAAGQIKTQTFRAKATTQAGVNYFNEVSGRFHTTLDGGDCPNAGVGTKVGQGGTSGSSATVVMPRLYDVQAVSGSGTIQSRVQLSLVGNQLTILSWQEF